MRNTCPPPVSNALEAQAGLLRRGRRGGVAGRPACHRLSLHTPQTPAYVAMAGRWQAGSGSRVRELDYVLTSGRYVGLPNDEDDFDFNERFSKLKTEFEEQFKKEVSLNTLIKTQKERTI